jgi:hypothetical protein
MPPEVTHWSYEETDDPVYADQRKFYKVEKWTRDGMQIERMIYAGNSVDRAREIFAGVVKRRPRGRYMIRQGIRVLDKWPKD